MKITDKNVLIFKSWYIKDCAVRNKYFFHFSVRNIKESRKASAIAENTVTKGEVGIYWMVVQMIVYLFKHSKTWGNCM